MVAYKEELLINTIIGEKSDQLYEGNFITKEQLLNIKSTLPALKGSKNILVRILFFFLGAFLYGSVCGLISITFLSNLENETIWTVAPFIFGIIGILVMELLIATNMKYYKNGLDDAVVAGILLSVGFGLGFVGDYNTSVISLSIFIAASICYLRYLNIPALLIAIVALVSTIASGMINYIIYGSALAPIVLAAVAYFSYRYTSRLLAKIKKPYYYQGIVILKISSTILFYISLNYTVITELSYELMPDLEVNTFSTIMSYFFILLTAIIPFVYIYFGLKIKDKSLFIVGILTLAASYFTLRYYYMFINLETELLFFGVLIFVSSYLVMKKLKNNLQGFTFLPDRLSKTNSEQLEVLASIAQFGKNATATESSPMEFGGGGFSGGGAGESF